MIFFGSKTPKTNNPVVPATALRVQTSIYGRPLALGWGRFRLSGNLFYYGQFTVVGIPTNGGGGGKGLGGGGGGKGQSGTETLDYSAGVMIGLGEGPWTVNDVWNNKTNQLLSDLNFIYYNGDYAQTAWGYVSAVDPTAALDYRGICYTAAGKLDLGSTPEMPNLTWDVQNDNFNGAIPGLHDADARDVVVDFLTNAHYGVGFPSARLDPLTVYSAYTRATGMVVSPVLVDSTEARSFLNDLLAATNSEFVWSGGVLSIVPYGDQAVTANGATYTPPSQPIYALGDNDFMAGTGGGSSSSSSQDPVLCSRKRPSDQMNSIKGEYLDRPTFYNSIIKEAKDDASIAMFGLRTSDTKKLHVFCDGNAALMSCQLMLGREAIRNTYTFTLPAKYILLDPMDIVAIFDAGEGVSDQWVRIREITENDDRSLTIVAEEYLAGTAAAPLYASQGPAGYVPNYNQAPGDINPAVLFEPPEALVTHATALEVWSLVSGKNTTLYGGCEVWVSQDNTTYQYFDTIHGPARMGVLTAPLPSVAVAASGQTIDAINTLAIDLGMSNASIASGTQNDALQLSTLCYVDGELLAYQNAVLTSGNKYNLSYLVRGAYGTTPSTHNALTQFARLDGGVSKYPFTADKINQVAYFKFLAFNAWGGGKQTLDEVMPTTYTFKGTALLSPLPNVTGFATAFVAGIVQLIWNAVDDFRNPDFEIRKGASWDGSTVVGRSTTLSMPSVGDGTYWIAAHFQVPNGPDLYSPTPISIVVSGSQLTSNVIATRDQASEGWHGTFNSTGLQGTTLTLVGANDVTAMADVTLQTDMIYGAGVAASGNYQIPTADQILIGYIAPCQVIVTLVGMIGIPLNATDMTTVADMTVVTDVLGIDLGNHATGTPQIRVSQDNGSTFGAWQNWIPGQYPGSAYDCRVVLATSDPQIQPLLSDLIFSVDVPDRDDHYTNLSLAALGSTITFKPDGAAATAPFNGGPNGAAVPHLLVTVLNGVSGDTVLVSGTTLTSATVQVQNAGVGVVRSVNVLAQGF